MTKWNLPACFSTCEQGSASWVHSARRQYATHSWL